MKLSKRLQAIADFVKEGSIVADIGTDHGHIPIYLIENNICSKVIASDISAPSLEKTISYVKDLGYARKVDTRLGNGLEGIEPYEVDTVIIAGMGGILIRDILEKDDKITNSIKNFIFQPMIGSEELRKYLYENKFKVVDEKLVKEDGKFYEILSVERGIGSLERNIYLEVGQKLIENRDPLLTKFIEHKIEYNEYVIDKLGNENSEKIKKRKLELLSKIEDYKEVLREYEGI